MSTTPNTTGPINAASVLKEMEASDNTEHSSLEETEQQLEETVEETTEELDEVENGLDDLNDDDDQESHTENPDSDEDEQDQQLDPTLSEAVKGNPKAEKRLAEITKGMQKLRTQREQMVAELEATKPKVKKYDDWDAGLSDPTTVAQNVYNLVTAAAKMHNCPVDKLLELSNLKTAASRNANSDLSNPDDIGQQLYDENELVMRQARTLEEVTARLAAIENASKELFQEREDKRTQAEFKNYVESIAPKTIKLIAKSLGGWTVTTQMIEETMRESPQQFKTDPVKAVKRAFPEEFIAFKEKAKAQVKKQRGPEALPQTTGKGNVSKPAGQYRAADALADILGS